MPTRFFLTHSWKDIDFARRLRNDLAASGVDGFFDAVSIHPGDIISAEINRGLEECDIYVPILSHAALQSPWCEEEIHAALTIGKLPGRNGRPRIVPILIEDCADAMPILLRTRLYIVFANRYDEALEELLTKAFRVPGRSRRQRHVEPPRPPRVPKAIPSSAGILESKNASAYLNRGVVYYKRGELEHALAYYNRALEIDPRYACAYYNRGVVFYAKGDLEHALADFNSALEFDPEFAYAYNSRGRVYKTRGDLERALADFNRALSLDPKYADAYNNRGVVYKAKGDLERALFEYNRALSLNPKYADAYNNRGNIYKTEGDLARALADYTHAVDVNPMFAEAYYNRGRIHRKRGSKSLAAADFEAYLRLAPNAPDRAKVEKLIRELKSMSQ